MVHSKFTKSTHVQLCTDYYFYNFYAELPHRVLVKFYSSSLTTTPVQCASFLPYKAKNHSRDTPTDCRSMSCASSEPEFFLLFAFFDHFQPVDCPCLCQSLGQVNANFIQLKLWQHVPYKKLQKQSFAGKCNAQVLETAKSLQRKLLSFEFHNFSSFP